MASQRQPGPSFSHNKEMAKSVPIGTDFLINDSWNNCLNLLTDHKVDLPSSK